MDNRAALLSHMRDGGLGCIKEAMHFYIYGIMPLLTCRISHEDLLDKRPRAPN